MCNVYRPNFEPSLEVLKFEKACQNQNCRVLKWEKPDSNPHPNNLQFFIKKSKPKPRFSYKKKNLTTVIITIQQLASKEVGNGVRYEGVFCVDGGKSVSGR
jgi:hypothetical protein